MRLQYAKIVVFAGKGHSCSPLKRLKPTDEHEGQQQQSAVHVPPVHVDSDDAELARKLHEQLNGPESPTAAPIARHISRVRKAPVFYKPEVMLLFHSALVLQTKLQVMHQL